MKSARIYDFSLPANGSFTLLVEGDYVRVMSATDSIEIVTDVMRLGPLKAGQGQQDTPFKRITINDKSGNANIGTILVASSGFIDQRINGEVSVIDGGKIRSLSDTAFFASGIGNAVAETMPFIQLFNSVGSGKNICISSILIASSASGVTVAGILNAPLANAGNSAKSKRSAIVSSGTSAIRTDNLGAVPGTFTEIFVPYVTALQTQTINFREPLVIIPGYGFVIYGASLASDIRVSMEFLEDSI